MSDTPHIDRFAYILPLLTPVSLRRLADFTASLESDSSDSRETLDALALALRRRADVLEMFE